MILKKLSNLLATVEKFIVATGILLVAIMTVLNVITRTFFNFSFSYAEEVSQFLILSTTFVGVSYAVTEGRHIRMSAIYDMMSLKNRKHLMLLITLTTSLLLATLTYWSLGYIHVVATLESRSPALSWPMSTVYLVCPLGLGLASAKYFLAFCKNLVTKEVYLSVQEKEHDHNQVDHEVTP